jgi:hypothetical protein
MRRAVLNAHEQGQENGKPRPTARYFAAAYEAIACVARADGFDAVARYYEERADSWKRQANDEGNV